MIHTNLMKVAPFSISYWSEVRVLEFTFSGSVVYVVQSSLVSRHTTYLDSLRDSFLGVDAKSYSEDKVFDSLVFGETGYVRSIYLPPQLRGSSKVIDTLNLLKRYQNKKLVTRNNSKILEAHNKW